MTKMISILNTIKKLLGPTEVYDHFDTDIICLLYTSDAADEEDV